MIIIIVSISGYQF